MSDILKGKTTIVTGAASGIGRAIAIGAALHGAKAVIVSDVDLGAPGRVADRRPLRLRSSASRHVSSKPT